ncbi:MAG: sulfatase [Myxococcota bacterium]
MNRTVVGAAVAASLGVGALTAWALWSSLWGGPQVGHGADQPPTVIFIVLDTVRADHTSLCGYDRPTTPVLDRLKADGASVSCGGVAPGGWTMPSHASYFTGLEVPDHGVERRAGEGHNPLAAAWPVVPLGPEHPTLATVLAGRGYQTRGLSANPALAAETGLQAGFDAFAAAPSWQGRRSFRGEGFAPALDALLADVEPGAPLFLFVNVFDAHDPYPPIPAGVDWASPQVAVKLSGTGVDGPSRRFLDRRMEPGERAAFLTHATDGYDWGIHQADAQIGVVLDALRARGALDRPWRLIVTSDHGEYLGEHGLLRHGMFLYEPNQRVPILVASSDRAVTAFPDPVSALVVHPLVLDGRLPDEPLPVRAAEAPHHANALFPIAAAASWDGDTKLSWLGDGRWERYELAADPSELAPIPLGDDPRRPAFEAFVDRAQATFARPAAADGGPELDALLEGLGYTE